MQNSVQPSQPSEVQLRDIEIVNNELVLTVGETRNLILRFIPENATNKTVTYRSLNESIVKVTNDGMVQAIGSGKTKIIVSSSNGRISEDCDVTIRQNSNRPDTGSIRDIKLNRDDLILKPGQTFQLVATSIPNISTEFVWYSKNPAIATVDSNGLVTAVSNGKTEMLLAPLTEEKMKIVIFMSTETN